MAEATAEAKTDLGREWTQMNTHRTELCACIRVHSRLGMLLATIGIVVAIGPGVFGQTAAPPRIGQWAAMNTQTELSACIRVYSRLRILLAAIGIVAAIGPRAFGQTAGPPGFEVVSVNRRQ